MSAIVKLSKNSGLYPECLILRGVQKLGQDAVAGGSFGDIWKGDVGGHMIAIKVMRIFGASNIEKVLKVCYFVLCTRGMYLSVVNRHFRTRRCCGDNYPIQTFCHFMAFIAGVVKVLESASFRRG